MIIQHERIVAWDLPGLEKYKGVVLDGPQGKFMLDEYALYDRLPLYSSVDFAVDIEKQKLSACEKTLFYTHVDQFVNGNNDSDGRILISQTNLQSGQAHGRFPQNCGFIATDLHFRLFSFDEFGSMLKISKEDKHQIKNLITWSFNIGGRNAPKLMYGPIGEFLKKREPIEMLMFPPNNAVEFNVNSPDIFGLEDNVDRVRVMAWMNGYTLAKVR